MNKLTLKEKQDDQLISVRLNSTKLEGLILRCEWRKPIGAGHVYWTEPQRQIEGFGKASEMFGQYRSLGKSDEVLGDGHTESQKFWTVLKKKKKVTVLEHLKGDLK